MKKQKVTPIQRKWWLIDARGKILGRLSTQIANLLRGKQKPIFSPHLDVGDYVVVINAEKIVLTGKKLKQKVYFRHSGYPGGAKYIPAEKLLKEKPCELLRLAVSGMLPKNKLRQQFLKKLKIYRGSTHPEQSQQLNRIEI